MESSSVSKSAIDLEIATKQLDRILSFFPRVEGKASFLFAVDSALLGVIAINAQKKDFVIWYHALAMATSAALICASLYFVYLCIFPSLKGGHSSLIYFREIAKLREAEYMASVKAISENDLLDDFIGQVWRNSEILGKKFDYIKKAFILTSLALLPWLTFLVLAALSHPELPLIK
jgi:hypothetical protein